MSSRIRTTTETDPAADWLIVPVPKSDTLPAGVAALDARLGGTIARLVVQGDVTGKLAETVAIHGAEGIAAKRVLLVGIGPASDLDLPGLEKALRRAARCVSEKEGTTAALLLTDPCGTLSPAVVVECAARAFTVGGIGQDLYRAEKGRYPLVSTTLVTGDNDVSAAAARGETIGAAINLTREMVNRHSSDVFPISFAERAEQEAAECGLDCTVLDVAALCAERMESMLAVARGSDNEARLVKLSHAKGGDGPTLALVGKGVTFDSGGLSLKPSDGMATMKCDMAGAATVLGVMTAIARLDLPINVVGYMGLVENMPSARSYKLGDVLVARNGVTIEVLNTDAEGRLVLADVLALAADEGADRIVDLATLTGACVVALGEDVTGAFTNDQPWCDAVMSAATTAGEYVWQLPMHDHFGELLKSDVADCKNVGPRWGGATTAAKFLEKFVAEKPWVHLDIAGPSFAPSNKPEREGGGTGAMVATLVELVTTLTE